MTILLIILVIAACVVIERRWPARSAKRVDRLQNFKVGAANLAVQFGVVPALGGITTLAVNAVGGGIFALPTSGWGLLLGALVYLAAMDLGEYLFHRAQHAIPWMWAMHSLHHSDTACDVTTTLRHFWLDPLLRAVTVWLAVGLLFKATPVIVLVYLAVGYYNFLTHANVRLGFGKLSWLWNSPQYHRIHHSASPEHFDVNFAQFLPIFDVICGTYYWPKQNEYPATGLHTGEEPRNFIEALTWPLHRRARPSPGRT